MDDTMCGIIFGILLFGLIGLMLWKWSSAKSEPQKSTMEELEEGLFKWQLNVRKCQARVDAIRSFKTGDPDEYVCAKECLAEAMFRVEKIQEAIEIEKAKLENMKKENHNA